MNTLSSTHHLAQRANDTSFYTATPDTRADGGNSDEMLSLLRSMSLKQNELIERSDRLERRNAELESFLAQPQLPRSSSSRGGVPSRATFTQLKKHRKGTRARGPEIPEVHDSDIEDPEPEVAQSTLASPSIYLGTLDLTGDLKRARDTLQVRILFTNILVTNRTQNTVTRVFRDVVGVSGTNWPDLTVPRFNDVTNERYLNPVFEATVAHSSNHNLFLQVAKQVTAELHVGINIIYRSIVTKC